MAQVVVGDIRLNVVEKGKGPPLLLVHGFPLDHSMWRGQIDDLSTDFRVIAPDLRGFGGSEVTAGVVTMEQLADDMATLVEKLAVAPITFCGLSMGGYVAWEFWRMYRHLLANLILCDTRAVADAEEVARGRLQLAEKVLSQGAVVAADSMLPKLFAKTTPAEKPELVESTRQVILKTDPQAIAAALRGLAQRRDYSSSLPNIATRTLVICGELDEISRADEMRGFAAEMPNAKFKLIPHAGHMAPLEDPAAVNAAIREFLR